MSKITTKTNTTLLGFPFGSLIFHWHSFHPILLTLVIFLIAAATPMTLLFALTLQRTQWWSFALLSPLSPVLSL